MRTRSWASLLLLAVPLPAATAQRAIVLPGGGRITALVTPTATILRVRASRSPTGIVPLKRDGTVARLTRSPDLKLIAEIPGSAILLSDTYLSLPGGLSYCQSGEEQFLRVITTSGKRPVESYHVKLASCRDGIELASPGLTWSAPARTLAIQWLSTAPASGGPGQPKTVNLTIDAQGRPLVRAQAP